MSDPLKTAEIDTFFEDVERLKSRASKILNTSAPTSTVPETIASAQVVPENAKKYLKYAVIAGAGWALYEVFTAGEEETK